MKSCSEVHRAVFLALFIALVVSTAISHSSVGQEPILLLPDQEKEVVVTLELVTPGNHRIALGSLGDKVVRATIKSLF